MAKINVTQPSEDTLKSLGIDNWGQWSCEISKFDWEYDDQETAYLYEGQVTVTSEDGESVTFGAGDLVVFPKGLKCTWDVTSPVRKRFKFGD